MVTCTIINWSHYIYYGTVRKVKLNNPNSLGMYCVPTSQFNSGLGWDKHRKVWHTIYLGKWQKNPNSLGMSCVSISQFHSVLGWYKHIKVWHNCFGWNIRSCIFMKQHSRYCIKIWRRDKHKSSIKHMEVNIQKIIIVFWV